MKVAIVHDWLYGGGAEKVVEELHRLYPEAPIYTSYCTREWRAKLDDKVVTGYLQHWPFSALRKFLPLLRQRWFAGLDLHEYDVVISSSGNGEARFVCGKLSVQDKRPLHISYTHTPTHFYYRKYDEYIKYPGFRPEWLVRLGLKVFVGPLRKRDKHAASKIDYFIANSKHIASDIKTYYERDSEVIHPPVDTARFTKIKPNNSGIEEEHFVMWGRHVPYKRFDIAVEACNQLGLKLVIIGVGPDTPHLKSIAGKTVKVVGRVSDQELEEIASSATAFIAPMEEDFGIAPVEALSAGLPVIAYKAGGSLDYVEEGKTGVFFTEQTVESLVEVLKTFDHKTFDGSYIASYAKENFDSEVFRKKIADFVDQKFASRQLGE